jgi:hypothetical protein
MSGKTSETKEETEQYTHNLSHRLTDPFPEITIKQCPIFDGGKNRNQRQTSRNHMICIEIIKPI